MTVGKRWIAAFAVLPLPLAWPAGTAASGEDCPADREARVMDRVERAIAWTVSEENDYCEGVARVSAETAAAMDLRDACGTMDADGKKRRYVHLTRYWAAQVQSESCAE